MKFLLVMCVVNAFAASAYALSPKVALRVRVMDEDSRFLSEIPVACIFPDKTRLGDDDYSIVTNRTGRDGTAQFNGRSYNGWVEYGMIERNGYYSIDAIRTGFTNVVGIAMRKWQPYDEIHIITMQKKGDAIPLFVRNEDLGWSCDLTTAPDRKFYYDLVKGDWLLPFGKGVKADIEFRLLPRKDLGPGLGPSGIPGRSFRDEIILKFIGDGNGIVSMTPPPNAVLKIREAPVDGYEQQCSSWSGRDSRMQRKQSEYNAKCQAFRIRTEKNLEGKVVSALYGKVYGGFPLTYKVLDHPSGVYFTYYLNLTPNDRNLEWDMEHNLCPVRESFNQP